MGHDQLISSVIGGCRIERKLGQGGMGTVFLGTQLSLERPVAIKILPDFLASHSQEAVDRFIREARLAAQINHPNIVQMLEVGTERNLHFMVMEYVDGPTLQAMIREKGGIDEKTALKIGMQIAMGLANAEKINLIHRDVKPSNILVGRNGIAKLADFGLVKDQAAQSVGLTHTGQVVGTPSYMSPEQANGEKADSRSDMYSLGATLFNALTGKVPYEGDNAIAILVRHISDPVPDPRDLNPEISDAASSLVMRLMAKERDNRFASYKELVPAIRKALKGIELELLERPLRGPGAQRRGPDRDRRPPAARIPDRSQDPESTPPTASSAGVHAGRKPPERLVRAPGRQQPAARKNARRSAAPLAALGAVTALIILLAGALALNLSQKHSSRTAERDEGSPASENPRLDRNNDDSATGSGASHSPSAADSTPEPFSVEWVSPADGAVLSSGEVALSWRAQGLAPEGCKVTLMGKELPADQIRPGMRSAALALPEGRHEISMVVSTGDGEPVESVLSLIVDLTDPKIVLDNANKPMIIVTAGTFELSGVVEDENLETVTVNGTAVKTAGTSFCTEIELVDGANKVTVAARDRAGHRAEAVFTVLWDSSIPETLEPGDKPGEFVNRADGAALILVPADRYQIHSPDASKGPVSVSLSAYLICAHEVTNAKFAAFLGSVKRTCDEHGRPYFYHEEWEPPGWSQEDGRWMPRRDAEDLPAANVTWFGADAYSSWAGGRLPTEAEWESAASFSAGMSARLFPWGDSQPENRTCNFGNHRRGPVAVGTMDGDRSELGVRDLGGNVMEWCADFHKEDFAAALRGMRTTSDPRVTEDTGRKSARGGSFWHPASSCRCSSRTGFEPGFATRTLGFRYVVETRK